MGNKIIKYTFIMIAGFIIIGFIVLVVGHNMGYDLRIVQRFSDIGIPSSDNEYFLVEMSDATGKLLVYSVIQINNDKHPAKILYITDDFWYHSRFIVSYGWIEKTNDFYINSSDTGIHRYLFDGNTWISEY